MPANPWHRVGALDELRQRELQSIAVDGQPVALSFQDGRFGAISGRCPHVGGPLGDGKLSGEKRYCQKLCF